MANPAPPPMEHLPGLPDTPPGSLMQQIIKAQPQTPGNVEDAANPNSVLNRRHGDLTTNPLSKQFTRQPRKQP